MDIGQTLYVDSRQKWRKWLQKNYKFEKEIWVVFPRKHTGQPCMAYNDAVEEALCYGWIDSIRKSLDNDHTVQRFSPRKAKSNWSQPNIERVRWLLKNNMISEPFIEEYGSIAAKNFLFPEDIIDEIKKNEKVWKNFQKFSDVYKRIRISYIEDARNRPEEFRKRLHNFLTKTEKNSIIGYGGIEKYY